jgi:hypothetical protein
VYVLRSLPAAAPAAVARWVRSADGDAAVQVAAQLSVAGGLDLVLAPAGKAGTSLVADLTKRGLAARVGEPPPGAIVVGPAEDDGEVHLTVVAGTKEASDDMDQWVHALDTGADRDDARQGGTETDSSSNDSSSDSSPRESRTP